MKILLLVIFFGFCTIFILSARKTENFFCFSSFHAYICTVKFPDIVMVQKEQIIEYAAKMFTSQGVKAVRMDDIAQELSISKRTLYELFGDKEELLFQSLKFYIADGERRRTRQIEALDNELEIMILCLRDMLAHAPEAGRIRRNLRRFYPSVYNRLEADASNNSRLCLRRWIKRCVEDGYLTPLADCDFVISVLHDSTQGMLMDKSDSQDSVEFISMISYAIVVFIRGLCTPRGVEVIDGCFSRYFGNIPVHDTLE